MTDLFDEVADMMAASWTVGRHVSREDIMKSLHAKFKTEDELRAAMAAIKVEVTQAVEKIKADGMRVVGIAQAVSKKDMH